MRINTREELINYIKNSEDYELSLFSAYKHNENIEEHKFNCYEVHLKSYIMSEDEHLYNGEEYIGSLKDRNIDKPNGYNDNYWFTTREEAEAYVFPHKAVEQKLINQLPEGNFNGFRSVLNNLIDENMAIPAIKLIRCVSGSGLKEAKDYYEWYKANHYRA